MAKLRAGTHPVQADWEQILPTKLFISYTQESSSHNKRVLSLANELQDQGFDCDLDQYHVNESWPAWMERSIEQAKHVLIVCTPTYRRRWDNQERPGVGLGATWKSGRRRLASTAAARPSARRHREREADECARANLGARR